MIFQRFLRVFVGLCLAARVADAVNCSANFVITNQADADELKGCPVVGGSVSFVNATGDIRVEGVQVILGALFTDDWHAPPMKSLYCDVASVNNIWLSNMTQMKSIDFPNLQQVDEFSLMHMPELTTLRLPQFALRARSSQFWNLAKLRELELSDELFPGAPFDDIYPRYPVGEVKAAYITQEVADALFNPRKTRSYPDVAIGHCPDVKNLNFSGTYVTSLTIEAGGDMTLTLPTASYARIKEVSITGVKEIKAAGTNDGKVIPISASNVTIHNNTAMTELFLPFSVENELRITSNPALERVFWHESLIGRLSETGKSLVIQDNAKLALQSSFKLGDGDDKFDGTFSLKMPWQNIGTSSAVFRGKFDNAFFKPLVENYRYPRPSGTLVIESDNPNFDCQPLIDTNGNRSKDNINVLLTCQKKMSLPHPSSASTHAASLLYLLPLAIAAVFAM